VSESKYTAETPSRLLTASEVGRLLGCSTRHILRLADRGAMPWGLKLGGLRRWDIREIENWVDGGCRPVREGGAA
jgi:excisionase family DNA binding protein